VANKDRDAVNHGLNDLLGNVLRNDRERAGRGKTEPRPAVEAPKQQEQHHAEVMDPPPVAIPENTLAPSESSTKSPAPDSKTARHYDTMTNGAGSETSSDRTRPAAPSKRKAQTQVVSQKESPVGRIETAQEMAETSTMTVTLRIPQAFNEWLDEYVHRSWPQKVRKQELVTEALKLLYARRGRAGEDIMSTPLLGEETE